LAAVWQACGRWFPDHPNPKNVHNGKFYVVDKNNFATKKIPDSFERKDGFYSFKNIDPSISNDKLTA
jgi:cytochrome c